MATKATTMDVLHLRISVASKVIWEGEALSVSSENSNGIFDILAMHSNFITLVRNKPITIVKKDTTKVEYNFKESVILVADNTVKIFANISS